MKNSTLRNKIRHQQNERTPELIWVALDDFKHLPRCEDVASDGVVLQVFHDEVRIHREAPASGARFSLICGTFVAHTFA